MSDPIDRGVKIPVFAGTSDAWTTWEPRFIATADLKGYGELLTGDSLITSDVAEIIIFKKKTGKLTTVCCWLTIRGSAYS